MPSVRIREIGTYVTSPRVMRYVAMGMILLGAILRLVVYLQNRNLFIDEANVARNIYERDLAGLMQPLSYEQYAPPVFLWVVKGCALVLGYAEYVLKLYPLLCGMLSLWLLYRVLALMEVRRAGWYPMVLFATGAIYLRYATELKQYSSDVMVALALVWLALITDILTLRPVRFVVLWILCGSLAVWSAMPAVFVLAAVGVYYFACLLHGRSWERWWLLALPSLLWLLQFGAYYFAILQPQADSAYLQNFHKDSFLYLLPRSGAEWLHNGDAMIQVLSVTAGHWTLSVIFHILCVAVAGTAAIRYRDQKMLLLIVPVMLLFFAAGLRQFSLQPRVILFVMPLLLVWIGLGLDRLLSIRGVPMVMLPIAAICVANYAHISYLWRPLLVTEVTDCLPYVQRQKQAGAELYIDGSAVPAYTYYTEIHPGKMKWSAIKGGTCLPYMANMDSISARMGERAMVLYSYQSADVMAAEAAAIDRHMIRQDVYKGRSVSQVLLLRKR